MQTRTVVRNGIVIAAMALMSAQAASAQNAREIVEKMNALYTNAKTYQVKVQMNMTMGAMGTMSMNADVKTQGNKKFYMKMSPGNNNTGQMAMGTAMMNTQMVSDGKTMYLYFPAMNSYMKRPLPPGEAGKAMMSSMGMGGMMPGDIKADKGNFKLVSTTNVGGRPVYVISYTPPANTRTQFNMLLYVDKSDYHYRQMKMEMSGSAPGQQSKMDTTMTFSNEKFNEPIPASIFVFVPPKGAKEMQGGPGMMGGMKGSGQ